MSCQDCVLIDVLKLKNDPKCAVFTALQVDITSVINLLLYYTTLTGDVSRAGLGSVSHEILGGEKKRRRMCFFFFLNIKAVRDQEHRPERQAHELSRELPFPFSSKNTNGSREAGTRSNSFMRTFVPRRRVPVC